jgi:hypothetical protein
MGDDLLGERVLDRERVARTRSLLSADQQTGLVVGHRLRIFRHAPG